MKILKIFGIVAGIHVFALILIFANPGCSSTSKPPPAAADTVMQPAASPAVTVPNTSPAPAPTYEPPVAFNPDAPAVAASAASSPGSSTVRFTPTRPGSPVAGTLVAEPVADVTPATTYTVKSGDNLWNLAKKNHLTVADLAAANGISVRTVLRPGQKLIIPGKSTSPGVAALSESAAPAPEAAKTTATKPPTDAMTHVVKSGETLGTIARRYGVKQGDIAVANNISDPQKIRAGMELVIPGWQTAGKSGKAAKSTDKAGKSAAAKSGDAKPAFKMDSDQAAPPAAPSPSAEVPVIRVDDSPISPAPKN